MNPEIKSKILALLDQNRIMTIATLRSDGWPQATTVGYVNDGLALYFLCAPKSQKAKNIMRDDRVSLTINPDASQLMEITGLSMAARAEAVTERDEAEMVLAKLPMKYPQQISLTVAMPKPEDICIFRIRPTIISVIDYTKGFGHTDQIVC